MARPPKPSARMLKLAKQALPKARKQRTAAEQRAVRLTRAWRKWNAQRGGGGQGGGGAWLSQPAMTEAQMMAQAQALAQGDLVPEEQALARERQRAAQESAAQQALIGSLTQSMGGVVGNIGPQMQNAYQQAAAAQGQLAQGFSGAMEQVAQAEAARNTADLAKWGGQVAAGDVAQASRGASDPLYGTGGFLPGSSLAQQGASWASYGASLPAVVTRMGQQDAGNIASSYAALQRELSDRAAELAAKLPGLRAQYMETLKSSELARDNQRLQWASAKALARQAGISQAQWEAEQGIRQSQNDLDWLTNIDPDTGRPYVDPRDRPPPRTTTSKRRRAREDLADVLASSNVEALIYEATPKPVRNPKTQTPQQYADIVAEWERTGGKRKVSLAKAKTAVRAAFAQEIREAKRVGVSETAITRIINSFLSQWYTITPVGSGANPNRTTAGRPGGYWSS